MFLQIIKLLFFFLSHMRERLCGQQKCQDTAYKMSKQQQTHKFKGFFFFSVVFGDRISNSL